jgi:hypothetical protein
MKIKEMNNGPEDEKPKVVELQIVEVQGIDLGGGDQYNFPCASL